MPQPLRPGDPVIVAARRTPVGTSGHGLASLTVIDLAAPLLADVAARVALLAMPVDEVIMGNCLGPGGNVARVAALAGLGTAIPGTTVDRQCASGLEAIAIAARTVASGDATLVLAGGAESASTAPWRFWPAARGRQPQRYARAPFSPPGFPDPDMGPAADALARALGISRQAQDDYAADSHARAAASLARGTFEAEILALSALSHDERPRAGMTAARLARLRPAFDDDGTATAGNSSGISDGAAVVAVTTAAHARAAGLPALRILTTAVVGGDPALPGACAAPATRKALGRTGLGIGDVEVAEITEAFASVALAYLDDLGLDRDIVCAQGGTIALGHPWGASGAILPVRLASRMLTADGPAVGVAACASGGGLGVAMVLERIA